ncbi:MAG: glycosyltransferase [Candidatus Rokubacteria bacterium]|nr:glycosyltransferase [Candidatus Rokubacteria bacterium]
MINERPIVLLITELAYGGTPRSLQGLALGLLARGHDVRVASLFSKADVAFELEAAGIPVVGFGIERVSVATVAWRLWRFLKTSRAGLLHTFNFHANLLGRVAGVAAGVPVIIASERSVESVKGRWRIWCDRMTWRLAGCWTVNAGAVATVLSGREGVRPHRIEVIPPGVDVKRFEPGPRDEAVRAEWGVGPGDRLVVCVGRLDRYKGQQYLLEAVAILGRERPNIRLALVGDGRFRPRLEAQASALGIGPRVIFSGALADVRRALAAADLFVLPSEEEGMPGAVLEAMAMGLPVVATAVGGVPEIVVDGETGMLVAPRQPTALAEAMGRVLEDPALAGRVGCLGRRRVVEEFSIERSVALTEKLYARLAGGLRCSATTP